MAFTPDELKTIHIVIKVSAVLGMLGAILIWLYVWTRPLERSKPFFSLVFALSIIDFVNAAFKLIGRWGPDAGVDSFLCQFQALMILTTDDGTLLVIAIMNWLIFASTTLSQADYTESFAKYQNLVIFLSFVWSLPFSMYAIFYQPPDGMPRIFGDAVTWCNINSPVYPNFLFAFYYGWQWLVFLFGILTTFMAWLNLYKMGKRTVSMRAFVIKKMTVYIIVFFIGHIFSNINRMNAMLHGTEIFILPVLQGVFSPSRGFLNFLAFLVVSRFQFHRSQSESVSKQIKSMNDQQLLPIPSNPVMSSEI